MCFLPLKSAQPTTTILPLCTPAASSLCVEQGVHTNLHPPHHIKITATCHPTPSSTQRTTTATANKSANVQHENLLIRPAPPLLAVVRVIVVAHASAVGSTTVMLC